MPRRQQQRRLESPRVLQARVGDAEWDNMFKEGKSAAGHMRTEAAAAGANVADKAKKTAEEVKQNFQHS